MSKPRTGLRRRYSFRASAFMGTVAALAIMAASAQAADPAPDKPMKIGIIGAGSIGGALAKHWARAGHEVFISSRHPDEL